MIKYPIPAKCPFCNSLIRNYGTFPEHYKKTGECLSCKKNIKELENQKELRNCYNCGNCEFKPPNYICNHKNCTMGHQPYYPYFIEEKHINVKIGDKVFHVCNWIKSKPQIKRRGLLSEWQKLYVKNAGEICLNVGIIKDICGFVKFVIVIYRMR